MFRSSLLLVLLVCACGRSSFTDREVSTCTPDCDVAFPPPALIRANEELIPTALVHVGDDELAVTGWLRRPASAIANRVIDIADGRIAIDNTAGVVFIARLDASLRARWRQAYGDAGTDSEVRDTASVGESVLTCGIQDGTVRFQGLTAVADSGYQQPVLTEHDASGVATLARVLPAARSNAQCLDIAASARMVAFTGLFSGDVTPGASQLTALADPNGFVAVYDRATMTPRWSQGFFDTGQLTALGVAIADNDALYVGGWFQGESTFGGAETLTAAGTDSFVLRYAADGALVWALAIGGSGDDRASDMATLGDDVILCMRAASPSFAIGDVAVATTGSNEAVIARITASGTGGWARVVSAPAGSACTTLAVDGQRQIHVGGSFTDSADFGAGPVQLQGGRGFVATYREDGELVRASVMDAGTAITDLTVTRADEVMALGTFETTLTAGGTTYDAAGQRAIFVMRVR